MNIRVTSVGNTEDGGWLIEFTRVVQAYGRNLTTVILITRGEGQESPPKLGEAINSAAGIARVYFDAMEKFNQHAEAHEG